MDNANILGFATVAPSEIAADGIPEAHRERLRRYPCPYCGSHDSQPKNRLEDAE